MNNSLQRSVEVVKNVHTEVWIVCVCVCGRMYGNTKIKLVVCNGVVEVEVIVLVI